MSAPPLRILHLTLGADAGGLSGYIIDLGTAMRAQGHEVTVAGDTGAWQWAFDQSGLKYIQIPLKGGYFAFRRCVRTLRDYLREHPVDVIHTHYRRATLLGRRLQIAHRPPIVYTLHLSHISLKFPRNLFTDFGDITHIASEDARPWLVNEARVPGARIRYIPHGIDVNRYTVTGVRARDEARRRLRLRNEDLVVLYVGRLDAPKNEGWMIDLAAAGRFDLPNLRVLLVGEGPHEPLLRQRIADLGLGEHVRVEGHQMTLPYYQAADAIMLPSSREGFSLVCAEAMSTGIPALRTRTSGTSELIIEGETGHSTPIERDAFVSAAVAFLRDRDALKRMGSAAAELIRSRFSFEQQLERTVNLYRDTLNFRGNQGSKGSLLIS